MQWSPKSKWIKEARSKGYQLIFLSNQLELIIKDCIEEKVSPQLIKRGNFRGWAIKAAELKVGVESGGKEQYMQYSQIYLILALHDTSKILLRFLLDHLL